MPEEKYLKEEKVEEEAGEENSKPISGNKISQWEEKAQEYLNGWQRCQADFENYKKRQAKFRDELAHFSNQSLIAHILPVVDNFQVSLEHVPKDQKESPWVIGIIHIKNQLEDILTKSGVIEIPVKVGDKFDPTIHEAVHQKTASSEQETEKEEKSDNSKVHKVLQRGYKMRERVLRAARVIVE